MNHKLLLCKFLFVCCFLFGVQTVFAQGSTTSSIRGIITDGNGEPLPGATVIAIHQPTGTQFGNITNVEGRYDIRNMNVGGPYHVTITFVGFEPFEKSGINLSLGQALNLDAQLSETTTELETVEIFAARDEVMDGSKTGASTVIGEDQLDDMPNVNRNLEDFTRLTPQASLAPIGGISIAGINNRYNAIFIDGAVNNDVFGLASNGQNGGQIGISPISIDALEQIQVVVAPYDVTLGGFAGGGINAVTRSGTNEFQGSAYYLVRNEQLAGKTPAFISEENREELDDFSAKIYGFRLGGPIIKNKLFFFVNAEIERQETPRPFSFSSYAGSATRSQVEAFADRLRELGYEPGGFEDTKATLEGEKILGKLDWNINRQHKLSIRHSYTKGESVSPATSNTQRIQFANAGIFFPSTTHSSVVELKSNFTDASNNLIIGYTNVNDDRDPLGSPFPYIIINQGDIQAGSEEFSTGNLLTQDIFTVTNNFNLFRGNHTFTFGTHNEFFNIRNVFIRQNFGSYIFNSIDDFLAGQNALEFNRSFSLVDNTTGDDTEAAAEFKALQLGFYAQDEIQMSDKLRVTVGLRLDIPMFTDDPLVNESFNTETVAAIENEGYDLKGARTGKAPETQFLLSPRVGFNYDLKGDQSTQIRGGLGIFTSRIPFVWPGGMYNNNGLSVGGIRQFDVQFNPDPFNQPQVPPTEPSGQIDLFAENFKFPQVFRTSLAVDQRLPWGLIGTAEVMYTKIINNIYYENLILKKPTENLEGTPDDRPLFNRRDPIDDRYSGIFLGSNTSEGYTFNATFQLQRPFTNGLTASVAYNFGRAEAIFEGTSSQNSSQWRGVHSIIGRNNAPLGRSDFDQAHRVLAFLSYSREYLNNLSTTISLFYNGQSGEPYSYIYNDGGALNNEDSRERNLIYVPASQDDIVFGQEVEDANGDAIIIEADEASASAQWAALNAYIENDDYLSERRGNYAEKNIARTPFESILDLKVEQSFFITNATGRKHALTVSFDIFNFSNFLNKDWGRRYDTDESNVQLIDFVGFLEGTNIPAFSFEGPKEATDLLIADDSGIVSSRWQAQLGVRYTF